MVQELSFKTTFSEIDEKIFSKFFNLRKNFENFFKIFFPKATKCTFPIFDIVSGTPKPEVCGQPNIQPVKDSQIYNFCNPNPAERTRYNFE